MFFHKKNPAKETPSGNLRRRFHHLLLAKRKSHLPQSGLQRPKRQRRIGLPPQLFFLKKWFWLLVAAGLILGFSYTALFSDFFIINKIHLEKNGNAIAGNRLVPFLDDLKGKNILFLNTEELTAELEQTFKNELILARIKKSYPKKIVVTMEEYPAAFNLAVVTPEKTQKFVLNEIGFAILENTELKELPVLTVRLPKPFPSKSTLIQKEKIAPMIRAFQQFREMFGMKTPSGEWKKTERELHVKTERNFTVWFDLTQDIDAQLLKLKRALPKLDIYHEPLEYIDLRIAGSGSEKVVFKKK